MPNASEMANSNEILSLYKHDERAALQKLFDIYYEPLLLYCYRLIRDSERAEASFCSAASLCARAFSFKK